MKRAHLLRVASLGAVAMLFALALSPLTAGTKTARRPNILFILSDDQRFDTIHALGNPEIQTPNLDRLVKRGFHFTERYRSQFRFEMFNALNRPQLKTDLGSVKATYQRRSHENSRYYHPHHLDPDLCDNIACAGSAAGHTHRLRH